MSSSSTSTFFVHLPSNSADYEDNAPNKFRVRLPKPLYFGDGTWVCGLHSIAYAYSWPLLGTVEDQAIDIHYSMEEGRGKQRVLHVPVPKASHTQVDELERFLRTTLRHQSAAVQAVEKASFVQPPQQREPSDKADTETFMDSVAAATLGMGWESSQPPQQREPSDKAYTETFMDSVAAATLGMGWESSQEQPLQGQRHKRAADGALRSPPRAFSAALEATPPSPPLTEEEEERRKKAKQSDLLDDLYGPVPGPGEKNRAEVLLEKIGLGKQPQGAEKPSATPAPSTPLHASVGIDKMGSKAGNGFAKTPAAAQPVTPAKTAKPDTPTKPVEPSKPATPAKPQAKPAEAAKPATPAKPQTKPAEPAKPATPAKPQAKPVEPSKPSTPAKPQAKPIEAAKPATPTKPQAKPIGAAKPATPARPQAKPVDASKHAEKSTDTVASPVYVATGVKAKDGAKKEADSVLDKMALGRDKDAAAKDEASKDADSVLDKMALGRDKDAASKDEAKKEADSVLDKMALGREKDDASEDGAKKGADSVLDRMALGREKDQAKKEKDSVLVKMGLDREKDDAEKEVDSVLVKMGLDREKSTADQLYASLHGERDDAAYGKDDGRPSLEDIRQIIDGVELHYHKDFARFKMAFRDTRIAFVSLSPQLGYMLGFEQPHRIENNHVAKYAPDLRGGVSSFGVYTRGLTENTIVGNSLSSLIRVVSVAGAMPGEYTEKIYETPIYVRVLPKEVHEIEIELRTMDTGRLVPFSYGTVMLVMVFKKVFNF